MFSGRTGTTPFFILTILFMAFTAHRQAFGYIDPGTTQMIWTSLAPVIGVLSICLFAAIWPIRMAWRFVSERWKGWSRLGKGTAVLGSLVVLIVVAMGVVQLLSESEAQAPTMIEAPTDSAFKGAIVLGIDGLDPKLLNKMMDEGLMPNFTRLRERGAYAPLQTVNPPQSPVAWTCAATGVNPGRHGLYDFVVPDRKTYAPKTGLLQLKEASLLKRTDQPFSPTVDRPAFWDILSEQGVDVSVIRWPMTFPPHAVNGRMLSGLGTPDVAGKLHAYVFYTTESINPQLASILSVKPVRWDADVIESELPGPLKSSGGHAEPSTVPIRVKRLSDGQSVSVTLAGSDPVTLQTGDWSDWIRFSFPMGMAQSCPAQVQAYLAGVSPAFGLYVGSCQNDPLNPAFPITYPVSFSAELAEGIGTYHTLGLPEEHKGYELGVIMPADYISKCAQITAERERMLDYELERFDGGLLAIVFATNDRMSHLFWPTVDPSHPAHAQFMRAGLGSALTNHYKKMDVMLGKVLDAAEDDVAVIVMSDHGFASSLYEVNINTWLRQNGYRANDWPHTIAYSVGFNGVYLNVEGREGQGIVREGEEYQQLREEIIQKLKAWIHPQTGKPIMRNVYARDEIYQGPYLKDAPDIILGYYPEYTTEIDSGAASHPDDALASAGAWPGNHMVDAPCVPGVFMSNFKINTERPGIMDICPTVLRCFNVPAPHDTDGKALF